MADVQKRAGSGVVRGRNAELDVGTTVGGGTLPSGGVGGLRVVRTARPHEYAALQIIRTKLSYNEIFEF